MHVRQRARETFLRAPFCGFGPGNVDIRRTLGDFGENRNGVGLYFGEARRDMQVMRFAATAVPHLTGSKQREQRRVPREYTEVAVGARNLDFVYLVVHERTLAGDDLQVQVLR